SGSGPVAARLAAIVGAAPTINPLALALGAGVVAVIVVFRRLRPTWPGMLIGLLAATAFTAALSLPVETIGSRFGGIPREIPPLRLPAFSLDLLVAVFPSALAFTLLGGLESLLSAKVADGMTGRIHRSNMELVA